jgi:hypothetical protein
MKKLYLFFCLILTGFISNAQIGKGTVMLGGNLSYDESSSSNNGAASNKNTDLALNPSFGKAIKDNLILGFDVTYGHGTSSEKGVFDETSNSFGAGIFLRKYKFLGNGFYLFGQSRLGGAYSHGSTTSPSDPNSPYNPVSDVSNSFTLSLGFEPGIAYALNRKWQLEIALPDFFAVNYGHSKETVTYTSEPKDENASNNFSAASTLTGTNVVSIGVKYLIGGPVAH